MEKIPYSDETIELLDGFLDVLNKKPERTYDPDYISRALDLVQTGSGARASEAPKVKRKIKEIAGILEEHGFIEFNKHRYLQIKQLGIDFFKKGGFAGHKLRLETQEQQLKKDIEEERNLRKKQIEDLEFRLENMEKALEKQLAFHSSSTTRNWVQIGYFISVVIISIVTAYLTVKFAK